MVSSHLKNLSQVGSFPQIGVNILKKYMKTTTQTHHWCQPIKSAFTPNAHRQACDLTGPCNVGRRDLKLAVGSFHMLVWVYCPLTYIIVDGHLKGEISNPPQKKNVILYVTIVYAGYGWDPIMIVVSACESVHSNILLVWGWHCFTGIFEGSVNMNDPYPETHIFSALLIGIFWFWLIRGRNFWTPLEGKD